MKSSFFQTNKGLLILSILGIVLVMSFVFTLSPRSLKVTSTTKETSSYQPEIVKSDEEWKKILTPQQYYVLREKGTDPAFSEDIYHGREST
jgi:peptide-methionine (R)-S-oxide reductase